MKVKIEIPDALFRAAVVSGVEGGIQYWAKHITVESECRTLRLTERDTDREFVITSDAADPHNWQQAIKGMSGAT